LVCVGGGLESFPPPPPLGANEGLRFDFPLEPIGSHDGRPERSAEGVLPSERISQASCNQSSCSGKRLSFAEVVSRSLQLEALPSTVARSPSNLGRRVRFHSSPTVVWFNNGDSPASLLGRPIKPHLSGPSPKPIL
jgi:hypothetical protein